MGEAAREYQPVLLKLQGRGFIGTCPARITGGGEKKYFGIYLHVVWAGWLDELNERGRFNREEAQTAATRATMREPPGSAVIKFNTSHRGDGYTYVAVRIANTAPGGLSWYVTTSEPFCHRCDESADTCGHFPFGGNVTWAEILQFVGDHRIDIATHWEPHQDWRKPPWLDRWLKKQASFANVSDMEMLRDLIEETDVD